MKYLLVALVACGPKVAPNGVTSDDAIVYVQSNVKDAQVFVDGRFVASLEALHGGVAMAPGDHRLELRREEFFSGYAELKVGRGEHKKLDLPLAPILP